MLFFERISSFTHWFDKNFYINVSIVTCNSRAVFYPQIIAELSPFISLLSLFIQVHVNRSQ